MPSKDSFLRSFIQMMSSKEAIRTPATKLVSSTIAVEPSPEKLFHVTVNYDQKLQESIWAGKYDWENPNITAKNFPPVRTGTAQLVVELVHFGRSTETAEIVQALKARRLRPATLPELLAVGTAYPNIQRQFPVLALGSIWQFFSGRRYVPALSSIFTGRNLRLYWWNFKWLGHYRFAAVSNDR